MSRDSPFERNLAPERIGPSRYRFAFDEAFLGFRALFGGVTLAAAARAAIEELDDPALRLRSTTCLYLAPIVDGDAEASVRVLRRGRSAAQVAVTLGNAGETGVEAIALFGRDRPVFSFTDRTMPDAPPPEACRPFLDAPEGARPPPWAATPLWRTVERRNAIGHEWWERGWTPTGSTGAVWLKLGEPLAERATIERTLAAVALTDLAGMAISEKLGPDVPAWAMTSADHTVHSFGAPASDWVLLSHRAHRAADGFVSASTELWDRSGTLVAVATQMIFVFLLESKKR